MTGAGYIRPNSTTRSTDNLTATNQNDIDGVRPSQSDIEASEQSAARLTAGLERVLLGWLVGAAALIFLVALLLTLFQVINLIQLLSIYAAITVITFLLGFALYIMRSKQ